MKRYDVAVIGSGVAGASAAYALRDAGKQVVMIEEDLWGGTCPNRGCDPKKVLLAGAEAVERNNQLVGKGLAAIEKIDWPQLMAFKHTFTDPFPASFKKGVLSAKIDAVEGSARFVSGNQIIVGDETITADSFVIATGQRPSLLDIEGKEHLHTSADFLDLEELPESMVFLGAGYIAFELAAIAHAAGSEVTIVHHNDRPLKAFDHDLVDDLVEAFTQRGIRFIFDVDIRCVAKNGDRYTLEAEDYRFETDYVVCATGRIPNIVGLDLEKAGVDFDRGGIKVNGFFQTSNATIYACGDVVSKKIPKLTPTASFEGTYVAKRILGDTSEALAYPPIVTIVFGCPKLAHMGISQDEARKDPGRYKVRDMDISTWFTYRRIGDPIAEAKLIFDGKALVGASVLGSQADELINYLAILADRKITHEEIDRMILGSPTIASDLPYFV